MACGNCRSAGSGSGLPDLSQQGASGAGAGTGIGTFLSSNKMCFKCATFWIIIVVLGLLLLGRSSKG